MSDRRTARRNKARAAGALGRGSATPLGNVPVGSAPATTALKPVVLPTRSTDASGRVASGGVRDSGPDSLPRSARSHLTPSLEPAGPAFSRPFNRRSAIGWLAAAGLIVAVAVVARLWNLGLAPFHNDEGVNGFFVTTLIRQGIWNYDPANYHGPTLFYAALASTTIFGLSEVGLRLTTALFGLGVLALTPLLRRQIGGPGALIALLLLAVSPGMVFFSRDIIHEMLLVFFTLAFVICATRWWAGGHNLLLVLAAAAAALMFATKETAILTFAVLGLSLVCLKVYELIAPRLLGRPLAWQMPGPAPRARTQGRARVQGQPTTRFSGAGALLWAAAAGATFLVIWVLLFSSFFHNPKGIADSLRSLTIWTQTSNSTQVSGPLTYLGWMSRTELPLLVFGLASALFVAWEGRSRFAIVCAAWAIGLFAAYSLIGYKTPWLMLNWVLPLAIVAGYTFGRAWAARSRLVHLATPLLLALGLAFSGAQAGLLAFHDYDNDAVNPYVYVPTKQSALDLVNWVRAEDAKDGAKGQLAIVVMSPEYWPLPWYFRDDTKIGFYGKIVDVPATLQIVRADQVAALSSAFTAKYEQVGLYNLRGAVNLIVYRARTP